MNFVVTGTAGFIGSKLSSYLIAQGNKVIGIDNLNDSYSTYMKEWRLKALLEATNFTFHKADITDYNSMEQILSSETIDAVFNLSARVGVRQSLDKPALYYETNVMGTIILLELCKKYSISRFVLASTSSIYGNTQLPFKEDLVSDRPISPYAASKRSAEILGYTYHKIYDLDISILRYFTVYGPAGRPDMSIFRFIRQISEGKPLYIYGDGNQKRDFTYVDDIVAGTVATLSVPGYSIINLGNDRPITILNIVEQMEKLIGKKAQICFIPSHPTDANATCADISKAKELINWKPTVAIEKGLAASIDWYNNQRQWVQELDIC